MSLREGCYMVCEEIYKRWMEKAAQCRTLKIVPTTMYYEGDITKRRLRWAGHFWRKPGTMIRTKMKEDSIGKIPLENIVCDKRCKGSGFKNLLKGSGRRLRYTEMNLFNGMVLMVLTQPPPRKKPPFIELICIKQHIIGKTE